MVGQERAAKTEVTVNARWRQRHSGLSLVLVREIVQSIVQTNFILKTSQTVGRTGRAAARASVRERRGSSVR
jgi:hypothetical protein